MSPCVNGTGVCTSPSAPYPGYVPPPGALGTLGWGLSREKYGSSVGPRLGEAEGGQGIAPSMGLSLVFFLELSPFPLFTGTLKQSGLLARATRALSSSSLHPSHPWTPQIHTQCWLPVPVGLTILCSSVPFYCAHLTYQCVLEPFL